MKIPNWLQKFNVWTDSPNHSIPVILSLGTLGMLFGAAVSMRAVWFMALLTCFGLMLVLLNLVNRKRGGK